MNSRFCLHLPSVCWCLFGCMMLAGCGSQTESPPPAKPAAPAPRAAQPAQAPAAGGKDSVVTAPVDYIASEIRAGQQAKGGVELITIRKAIEAYQEAEEGRNPQSLNELVEKKYLNMLPTPPATKQFEYDAATGTIKLVPKS